MSRPAVDLSHGSQVRRDAFAVARAVRDLESSVSTLETGGSTRTIAAPTVADLTDAIGRLTALRQRLAGRVAPVKAVDQ